MAEKHLTIFYSWQAWTLPENGSNNNRNFIQDALERAAKLIMRDTDTHLIIDRDTKDVPSHPPIMETVMAKIDSCDMYVADVSYVIYSEKHFTPNPNVMIELGYALHALSERFILVMNTAHGSPKDHTLPFDFQHRRFPITYHLEPDADGDTRRVQREDLVKKLKEAIELIIESPPKQVQDMINTLNSSWNPDDKKKALELLGQLRSKEAVTLRAIGRRLIDDTDWQVRIEAAKAFDEIGDKAAIPYMVRGLNDENPSVRNAVVKRLGNIGQEAVIEAIASVLDDLQDLVSKAAAQTLIRIGTEEAFTHAIKYHIARTRVDVNAGITSSFGKVSKTAIRPLLNFLTSEDAFERTQAASLLFYFPDLSVEKALIDSLSDTEPSVVAQALSSLTHINSEIAQPYLLEHITSNEPQIRAISAAKLGYTASSDTVISALRTALEDNNSSVQKNARHSLEMLGKYNEK
jgi:HEAT repeat protein